MDTTPEYIKMCEKAEELEELWQPTIADMVIQRLWQNRWFYVTYHEAEMIKEPQSNKSDMWKSQYIWLPRQDQLQEMVFDDIPYQKLLRFTKFCQSNIYADDDPILWWAERRSIEQLWLMFMMFECHNKTWNGEEWKED